MDSDAHMTGSPVSSGRKIRQKRSQKTYDALISTAFKMLEQREFDEISIAELAKKAGYSVGAFYSRFRSKDELFDAMVERHIQERLDARAGMFESLPDDRLINALIEELVSSYWSRRKFWRAALIRSVRDPDFWEPIRKLGHKFGASLLEKMSSQAGRPLTETEETNIRFAVQLALGTINNAIINRPGPLFMGQALFVENLARAFRLVSGYDEFARPAAPAKRKTKRRPTPKPTAKKRA
jgi:AcrR family transcriptional regulator